MTQSLKTFLADLAVDPDGLGRFLADPAGSLRTAGLSDEDVAAVESGDRELVYARLTGQRPAPGPRPPFGSLRPRPNGARTRPKGSLVVVGTGIRTLGQLTIEAIAHIKSADKVLYVVSCPVADELIENLNPEGAESLSHFYEDGKDRALTYRQMVDRVLACVREGLDTCLACYGHPGVFVTPSHEAIRLARAEGFPARMLPGISAEDCLFADLGVDPATAGCQTFEATDFLLRPRLVDPSSSVIIWQVGILDSTHQSAGYSLAPLPLLLERLYQYYPPDHLVYVYEAAVYAGCDPVIKPVPLFRLGDAQLASSSTLFIPPARPPQPDPVMHERFRMTMPGWG